MKCRDLIILPVRHDIGRCGLPLWLDHDPIDTYALRPQSLTVCLSVSAKEREHLDAPAKERERVCDVSASPAESAAHLFDDKAHRYGVQLIGQQVVPKHAGEYHDVIVREGTRDKYCAHGVIIPYGCNGST